jgi:hypothetical protein
MDDNAVQCPMCGSRVPQKARACLNCGEPVPEGTLATSPGGMWLINLTAVVILIADFSWIIIPELCRKTVPLSDVTEFFVGLGIAIAVIVIWPIVWCHDQKSKGP